jgi:formate hydrogenlyase transcriptional activator
MEIEVVLDRTAKILRRYFGKTRVGINLISTSEPEQAKSLIVDDPQNPTPEPGTRFPLAGSLCGQTVEKKTVQVLENLDPENPRFTEERALGEYGYGSLASIPLIVEGRIFGTLDIAHRPKQGLLPTCLNSAQRVAQLVGIALHNSILMEEVRHLNRLLDRENDYLKAQIQQARQGIQYIADSPSMKEVMRQVKMVASTDTTVLIRGETGTGKEGLARLIHEASVGSMGPFVVVNMGAIPEGLIESELFGHEKGAFTGAHRQKLGRFEQASGGTIFLDEVGDAPLAVQVKLLRALQERHIERVGGTASVPVNARVVAATNRDLEHLIDEGCFRLDLFYRLNSFPIHLPPLRERLDDLRPLVQHLLSRQAERMHRRPPRIPDHLWPILESYSWPGNVRQLENYIERALILTSGSVLEAPSLEDHTKTSNTKPDVEQSEGTNIPTFNDSVRKILNRALEASRGKIYGAGGAAELLQLKPTTLQGKLKRYNIKRQ